MICDIHCMATRLSQLKYKDARDCNKPKRATRKVPEEDNSKVPETAQGKPYWRKKSTA